MLLFISIASALITTAFAFDKERNVAAWYCVALLLPMVAYALTDAIAVAVLAAALPVAFVAIEPAPARVHRLIAAA